MFTPTPKVLACAITAAIVSNNSFANTAVDATVENTAQDMEVVVVSGTRSEKLLKDVAGSISVITSEDLEQQVIGDMSQLFKYDPSVQVTGEIGGAQNFIVRGMGGDRVLMIKDGMRMSEGYGANGQNDIVGRGFIETDILKQVEVAKGAASSLYGSDALAGIVVFTTKDASDYLVDGGTFAGNVKLGFNSLSDQAHIGATLATKTGDFDHLLNLNYRDGKEQKSYHESDEPFDISSHSIFYKNKYLINDNDFISFTADLWKQDIEGESADGLLYYFRGLAQYGYNIAEENSDNEQTTDAFKLSYHSETKNAFYDQLNLNLYSNVSEQKDTEYGQLDINAPMFGVVEIRDMWKKSNFKQDTVGFLSNASLQLNNQHTLGYGLDIEKTDSERNVHEYREVEGAPTKDDSYKKFPKTETFRAGIFINDEISLLDGQLTVTPGIRFDSYDMDPNGAEKTNGEAFKKFDETHTSFNLGALYKFNPQLSFFAQYGQGFKVPAYDLAYIEHYNKATSTYLYEIIPSDDLSPEESDSYEIGVRGNYGDFSFNSAIYYNKYDNFLATELVSSEQVFDENGEFDYQHDTFQYQNIDSVTVKGIEVAASYFINNSLSIFANASYQDGENDDTKDYINTISPLSGVVGLSYQTDALTSELVVNWADRMDKVNDGNKEIAGYGVVDLLVNYEVTEDININMNVNNVFDKEYTRYLNVAGHAEDASLENFTEAGRTVAVSVNLAF